MADKETKKINAELDDIRDRSSTLVYGMPEQLSDEDDEFSGIVQRTIIDTKTKWGARTNNKPIRYFNEINYGEAFSNLFINKDVEKKMSTSEQAQNKRDFKRFMTQDPRVSIDALLQEDAARFTIFNNYRIIKDHIPECSRALKIYKDNIISPDDFTKLIFNVEYEKADNDKIVDKVNERLDDLNIKYELEDKVDAIIDEVLTLGKSYRAVLSLEDEMSILLNEKVKVGQTLNEAADAIRLADTSTVSTKVLTESIKLNSEELTALQEEFREIQGAELSESKANEFVAAIINENIQIGSSKEYLIEKFAAENDFRKADSDISDDFYKGKGKSSKKKKDEKLMYLNGSVIRTLKPENVVELTIDGTCYGYYYAEETKARVAFGSYIGTPSGRDMQTGVNIAQNNTISNTTYTNMQDGGSAATRLGVGEQKLKVITDVFINQIANKIDKDFIRKNKQFKDFIYELLRQDYIIKKGIKLTYFRPDEVIKFETEPLFKDITFFAKLYLAILSNTIILKMGRAHDKRIFYINVGADAQYEQAIQSVIEDVKTKDYKMDTLNDFNTILNLAPGRFDDYFMPSINGEHPIDIETIQGMDTEMSNDFIDYLKNSMMSGMDVPRNLIDVTSDVDYARSISAMNSNFVRAVVKKQKQLTAPFTRMYQIIYKNEFRFANDEEQKENVDIEKIRVKFPSPATLIMNKISEEIQQVDQNADYIASTIVIPEPDGSNEMERQMLKAEIAKKWLPNIDWQLYEDMHKKIKLDLQVRSIENRPDTEQDPMMMNNGMDPYGQY